MTLRSFVLFDGKQRAEVTVQDANGKYHRVVLQWRSPGEDPPPPSDWPEMVKSELEYQRSISLAVPRHA